MMYENFLSSLNQNESGYFQVPSLNYSFNELEPWMDSFNLECHVTLHHKSYVNKLNSFLNEYRNLFKTENALQILSHIFFIRKNKEQFEELIDKFSLKKISDDFRHISFFAGGHINHSLFWNSITKYEKENIISLDFEKEITLYFGSLDEFIRTFIHSGINILGSGYVWLVVNKEKQLELITTPNQDYPLNYFPLICCDVWEHSYYLKLLNDKKQFLTNFFSIINWDFAEKAYNYYLSASEVTKI